jgi:Pyruvate/2-oxoacid:ferredoxin oxidoreductase delta subunit
MEVTVTEAVTLFDKNSRARKSLFALMAISGPVDVLRFMEFLAPLTRVPVIGAFIKVYLVWYYKYVHTKSVKLPLKDIEAVINAASEISIGPCVCRLIHDDRCDTPLYTCMRINSFSEFISPIEKRENERGGKKGNPKSRVLTREEGVEIARNARKLGMVLQLESCVIPYQNNICMCCTCCCVEILMRKIIGPDMGPNGPYVPVIDKNKCSACGICEERCPFHAVVIENTTPVFQADKCANCGICSESCPNASITMQLDKARLDVYPEPGMVKTGTILVTVFVVFLFGFLPFKFLTKSQQNKYHAALPRKTDVVVTKNTRS